LANRSLQTLLPIKDKRVRTDGLTEEEIAVVEGRG
jgi:hypothetical protein